jgi:hypothetical protein
VKSPNWMAPICFSDWTSRDGTVSGKYLSETSLEAVILFI